MSWQGTVIKKHKYAEAQYMGDRFLQILSEQAEISYKAGAKEERERIIDYFGENIVYWEDALGQHCDPKDCAEFQALKGGSE